MLIIGPAAVFQYSFIGVALVYSISAGNHHFTINNKDQHIKSCSQREVKRNLGAIRSNRKYLYIATLCR
ncbi:MAG: hypothetical protein JWP81_5362 [Ferruginibacter sp.]|nr:hypothetical protein [Ferruginibacter sp.]